MINNTYLPFTIDELKTHFVKSSSEENNIDKHVSRYIRSVNNYNKFENGTAQDDNYRTIRQIEKDETFWTASALMSIYHSPTRNSELKQLLTKAFGEQPPLSNFESWDDCLNGDLHLFFEPNIPSPQEYKNWLRENVDHQNFIPYILDKSKDKEGNYRTDLEGPTNVDAILINSSNGFSVFVEAKVLSDISYQISYDCTRNQIIRNIDVMMNSNPKLAKPLCNRIPENTLFLLLTPQIFQQNPESRLYGYKFNDYKNRPETISKDMRHRKLTKDDCIDLSKRIGWTTWEDLKQINSNCCKWL